MVLWQLGLNLVQYNAFLGKADHNLPQVEGPFSSMIDLL